VRDDREAMGRRLRELRIDRGLPQGDVAQKLAVSPAYLSLMEKGKRAVQLPLLFRALELYGVSMEEFMASLGATRVDEGLSRLLDEPLFRTLNLTKDDLASIGSEPRAATTITALFNLYKNTRTQLDHLVADLARKSRPGEGAGSELAFDYSPFDEVTDFLESRGNFFPELEDRAEALRREHGLSEQPSIDGLVRALRALGVEARVVDAAGAGESSVIRRLDPEGGQLTLSRDVPEARLLFQLAHTLGLRLLDREKLMPALLPASGMPASGVLPVSGLGPARHAETPHLLKIHFANYFGGALLLPYGPFLREVQRTRYDVERLSSFFRVSYETVAHRLCNLSDPLRRGVPFHFLRVDAAGNISKRYAATGLRFPHGTGSCPKWAVHLAFLTPHAIARQYSVFPDGRMFFCFAKVLAEPVSGSLARGSVYAIGMGTHADNAKHLAYADDIPFVDPEKMVVPVGTTCRFCERTDCNQRAAPSYKFAFRVDPYIKKENFFSPLVSTDETRPEESSPDIDVSATRLRKKGARRAPPKTGAT
jgi:predicted transcriptional regulator/transcriptional regulator with XRE-family HTH domain